MSENPRQSDTTAGGAVGRRTFLKIGATAAVTSGLAVGTATAANHQEVEISDQRAFRLDRRYPVPTNFAVVLSNVAWEDAAGTIALPVEDSDDVAGVSPGDTYWYEATDNAPAFVIGVHSPEVGSGEPDSLSSLVGVKPLTPGAYSSRPKTVVPVWQQPPRWQQQLGASAADFPSANETVELTATLWYGPAKFPPAPEPARGNLAEAPNADEIQEGPVYQDEQAQELVSSSATVEFPVIVTGGRARDIDGDDRYEDIDGDGELGLDDVQAFFENRNSDIVENNPGLFDFDGQEGSGVSLSDVQALYQEFLD